MEKINISEINFDSLKLLDDIQCSESKIYVDQEGNLYKLYKDKKPNFNSALLKKMAIERLYELNKKLFIEHAVISKSLITKKDLLKGVKEDFKKGFHSLIKYKEFLTDYDDFLTIYLGTSETIEKHFHRNGILYSDMKLDNIIFKKTNNKLEYFLVDTDSSSISNDIHDITFTSLIRNYLLRKNNVYYLLDFGCIKATPDFDKLVILVTYLESLFEKLPIDIDGKKFNIAMDKLNISDEGIKIFEEIVYGDNNPLFVEWPYIHDIMENPSKVLNKHHT
ncbi:MAG: hypothetical protein WDA21_03125 [Bacilli bacterium]